MYTEKKKKKFKNLYTKQQIEKNIEKTTKKKQNDSVYHTPTLKWHNVPNVPRNTIPEGWRK
jgi:hypothetical protein